MLFSSIVDYSIGLALGSSEVKTKRKLLLLASIITNLGFLGFFKYYNFFVDNFVAAFSIFGVSFSPDSLNIILPVGISFYTFQTLSYSIDVYNRKLHPTKDVIAFFAFVSFFPQLVAGPIERATNLLPQFTTKRSFNYDAAISGLRQILWGLFKKIVIADNCAEYVNIAYSNPEDVNGSSLIIAAICFSFQIYCDFSGYSDIAIGTARLFGFNLMQNFAFPYFSRDIAEFWRRWHISLSTWFRDYVYIPLGGSKVSKPKAIRNTFVIFILSGFWHGANWTFIFWGILNALYFLPLLLTNNNRKNLSNIKSRYNIPSPREIIQITSTFLITTLGWIFFRAENLDHANSIFNGIFSSTGLTIRGADFKSAALHPFELFSIISGFMLIEWIGRNDRFAIEKSLTHLNTNFRWGLYILIISLIFIYSGKEQEFIYFQF